MFPVAIRLVAISLAALITLVVGVQSLQAQSVSRFRDTPGARAFAAKDYPTARIEFERLRDANPGNVLILRYLAITLDALGESKDAITLFQKALDIAPANPALHYHLGVAYYNAQQGDLARQYFVQTTSLASNSRYAELANRYLDALAIQMAQQQTRGAPRRFGVFAQGRAQRDNNVTFAANEPNTEESETSYSTYLGADYYLLRTEKWIMTIGANGFGNWYDDDTTDSLSVRQYGASALLQKSGQFGSFPYVASLRQQYYEMDLEDDQPYSETDATTLGLRVNLSEGTATKFYTSYTRDNFSDEGFDPAFSSRDADVQTYGIEQTWYFAERRGLVALTVEHETNDANGVNFVMDGVSAGIDISFRFGKGWRTQIGAKYFDEEYPEFAGPVIRETDRTNYDISLSRWFGQRLQVLIDYSYDEERSSYDALSYDRAVWGVALNYVF